AAGVVLGVVLSSAATFVLSLFAGLNDATVFAGPLWVVLLALATSRWTGNPARRWVATGRATLARWSQRPPIAMAGITVVALVLAVLIYSRTVYQQNGSVLAGYETVWADWSQHLSTASSFAIGGNIPPTNPLFSGTPLLYPFLPDFHAATLMTLGLDAGTSLALGSGVLAFTLVLLVIAVGRRVGLTLGAALIATAVCLIGGGLGFVGVFGDACVAHGYAASQCTVGYIVSHPGDGLGILAGTLHDLPGVIAAQPRAYDGLLSTPATSVLPNQQWYTPLFAWWLPQRSMLYGFDLALTVLLLVFAGLQSRLRAWTAFAVAAVGLGVMPLVHAQTLFALAVLLTVLALFNRRREWIALGAVAVLLAAPRLVQIALAPHGSVAGADVYPYYEPGWEANASDHLALTAANTPAAVGKAASLLLSPQWWGFWVANLGLALPLCVVVSIGLLAGRAGGRLGAAGARFTGFVPRSLLELLCGAMIVFALCDVVVFQSWDWDNTKLLVYWYLVAGMLAAALASHWWRRGAWRTVASVLIPTTMLLTGAVVMLRLLPWTPPQDSVTGPYSIASADEVAMAREVAAATPGNAVFLTFGRPNDPLLAVAGRTSVMGYYGWLWSYGTDFGTRIGDVQQLYQGCSGTPCDVSELLHEYHVSYVEIDDRVTDSGAITQSVNAAWWASQGFPVVARSVHITVYDVRSA
ncbi:MAG: hypothetical protein JOY68_01015, partial [Candidatus Dormibacteraeota bacterium]|nr:hypothetical protein [Candidatus Dormibacteraeota bacterium]